MEIVSFYYSIPYLFLLGFFLLLTVVGYLKNDNKWVPIVIQSLCLFTFLLFFGFRGFIGWDWINYYDKFINSEGFQGDYSANFSDGSDWGFVLYTTIIRTLTSNYHVFVFISVLIDVIILHKLFTRYSLNYAFSFAILIVLNLTTEVDTLRNMRSIMIVTLALPYIYERNWLKYYLLMMVAFSFHASAIVFFPFYFFAHRKISKVLLITVFIIGNIVYLFQIPLIKPLVLTVTKLLPSSPIGLMIERYMNSDLYSAARGINLSYIERCITGLLTIAMLSKVNKINNKDISVFINLYLAFIIVSMFMSEISVIFDRLGALFVISYWILWPALLASFPARIFRRSFLGLSSVYLLLLMAVRTNTILYKYDSVLVGYEKYDDRKEIFFIASDVLLDK